MKSLYRYRVEPFHWMFTDFLKSSATVRYDLYYHSAERKFQAEYRRRAAAHTSWSQPVICTAEVADQLRAELEPGELARCAAASMRMNDADA
jgi:hypothetical protein